MPPAAGHTWTYASAHKPDARLACRRGRLGCSLIRQDGRCSYCHDPLSGTPEADHFIPRIRCGIDAIENMVLADRRCNNDKRDLLPGPAHVASWAIRNQHHDTALAGLATDARWDTDPAATIAVARSIYSHLPHSGTPLWLGYKTLSRPTPPRP